MSAVHDHSEDHAFRIVRALRDEDVEMLMSELGEWMIERDLHVPKDAILNWSSAARLTGVRIADVRKRDWDGVVDTDDPSYFEERRALLHTLLREIEATGEADADSYLEKLDEALPPGPIGTDAEASDLELDALRGRLLVQTEHVLAYSRDVLNDGCDGPPFKEDGLGGVRAARIELEWHRDEVRDDRDRFSSEQVIGGEQ